MKFKKRTTFLNCIFFLFWGKKSLKVSFCLSYGELNFLLSAKITEIFLSKCISI